MYAQDSQSQMYIFGHSLIHHEFQINPTPSQETSVPHWLHFLSETGGHQYAVSGQYGFLPQHANLPPISQWGFDHVAPAWDSDGETFAEANITDILLTPGNFIQWQSPEENYPGESVSPVSATNTILRWCAEQEEDLSYYVYENWPDMAPYLGSGFPPNEQEWIAYNDFLQGDFATWFDNYYDQVRLANPDLCIQLIPVGRLISKLLQMNPYKEILIDELYEDDAPHGRPNIYFLASMIVYMAIYEEPTPMGFQVDAIIDPLIRENYDAITDYFWSELINFNDEENQSLVFCGLVNSVGHGKNLEADFRIIPNPVNSDFIIDELDANSKIEIYNITGQKLLMKKIVGEDQVISLTNYEQGVYFVKIFMDDKLTSILKFIKLSN